MCTKETTNNNYKKHQKVNKKIKNYLIIILIIIIIMIIIITIKINNSTNRASPERDGDGVLNKVLYGGAPPRGSTSYPFTYHF